jgi:polar amino acid transport system substrate-binding protein
MKTRWFIYLFLLGMVLETPALTAGTVEITTFSYPPYMNNDGSGLLPTVILKAFKYSGLKAAFKVYPRKRAVLVFEQSETRGFFLGERSYFPDQAGYDIFTLMEFKTVFVYMKNRYPAMTYKGLSDLKGKRVGVSFGSVLIPIFKDNGMLVDEAQLENNIMKLKSGRIDFWHTVDSSALGMIDEKYPGEREKFGFLNDETHTVDMMVKKGGPDVKAFRTFVKGFNTMVKKGDLQKILKEATGKKNP